MNPFWIILILDRVPLIVVEGIETFPGRGRKYGAKSAGIGCTWGLASNQDREINSRIYLPFRKFDCL